MCVYKLTISPIVKFTNGPVNDCSLILLSQITKIGLNYMFLVSKTLQKNNLGLSGSLKYKARKVGIWAHDQKCAYFAAS